MTQARVDVGSIRREQIVEAAVAVIAEQGIQNLSLSEIEKRAEMSRGQLTYYFKTKEDILLAVFDRLLQMLKDRARAGEGPAGRCLTDLSGWERVKQFLSVMLLTPPNAPEFHALQYTFLSQIAHRDDFRQRLANLYGEWRLHMASDFEQEFAQQMQPPKTSPRTLAALLQAIFHGLAIQRAADPDAFDRQEMLDLCLHLLGGLLRPDPTPSSNGTPPASVAAPRRSKTTSQGPNHE
jgi:AcrR family transcriptional regulator